VSCFSGGFEEPLLDNGLGGNACMIVSWEIKSDFTEHAIPKRDEVEYAAAKE
jgi:hypothetical protein